MAKPRQEEHPVEELDRELAAERAGDIKFAAGPDRNWSIWRKIHWVQGKLAAIPKDAELEVGRGRRVPVLSHNALVAAVRPMLDQAGLVLLSTVIDYEVEVQLVQKSGGETYSAFFHKLRKHYTLVNVDGGLDEVYEFDGYGTAITPTDKGYGAAESYCKKYALRSLFLVETDDDPDVGENVEVAAPQARAPQAAAPPQQRRQQPAREPAERPAVQTATHPAALEVPHEAWVDVADKWHDRGTISDAQLGRLFAIARGEGGWQSGDDVEAVVKHHLGIDSMHSIPWGKPYDALVEIFRQFGPSHDDGPGYDDDGPY
jgi:hypothetical protein